MRNLSEFKANEMIRLENGVIARKRSIRRGGIDIEKLEICENGQRVLYPSIESYYQSICLKIWFEMSQRNQLINLDLLLLVNYRVPEHSINAVLFDHKEKCMTPWNKQVLGIA